MKKLIEVIKNPQNIIKYLKYYILIKKGKKLSDREYLTKIFALKMAKKLDLENPRTFNEKLQWLKLYNHNAEYTRMVDKFLVRNYVSEKIGEEYLIPLLGVWDHPDKIDFNSLPQQFVLKCNHNSGLGMTICKNKSLLDISKTKKKLSAGLSENYYFTWREWPYKNVNPCIIAEKYMEDKETGELRDYKFFCFNGKVKAMFIATDRQKDNEEVKFDFFDSNFTRLDLRQGHPNSKITPNKPKNFELMKELAEKLSEGIPHVRVDFYEVNNKVYFGEMTFFHFSGIVPFEPENWDYTFGNWLDLNQIK